MKKILFVLLILAVAFSVWAGGNREAETGFSGDYAFGGSTTVDPIITAAIEEWKGMYPDVHISYEGVGSSNGIKGIMSGQYTLGAASRDPKDKEAAEGVRPVRIALDAIAPVVNKSSVTVGNLTLEQLAGIYAGEITNWSEVGGADGEIVVFNRDESSGTFETFETKVMKEAGADFMAAAGVVTSNGDMAAKVGATPHAIGYVGLGYVGERGLKPLSVNGIKSTIDNVYNESYPIWRYLNVVYVEQSGLGDVEKAFIEYILNAEGQSIVEEEGFISLPGKVVDEMMGIVSGL